PPDPHRQIAVLLDAGREMTARELLGQAARVAAEVGGSVLAIDPGGIMSYKLGSWGAASVLTLAGSRVEQDLARELSRWCAANRPWAMLFPGTMFGREISARIAAALG